MTVQAGDAGLGKCLKASLTKLPFRPRLLLSQVKPIFSAVLEDALQTLISGHLEHGAGRYQLTSVVRADSLHYLQADAVLPSICSTGLWIVIIALV